MIHRLAIVMFICLFPAAAFAASITLTTGETVTGKIVKQDKDSILLDTGIEGTTMTYYRSDIAKIDDDQNADAPADSSTPVTPDDASKPIDPAIKTNKASADKLEDDALAQIDNGQMQKGLDMMVQAINADPNPTRYMNYGSILFGNGVSVFKSGNAEEGNAILHRAEDQLQKAIDGFDKSKDGIYLSQCYFLLGEMYANAFNDKDKAKEYYQKSVTFYDHPAAAAALKKL